MTQNANYMVPQVRIVSCYFTHVHGLAEIVEPPSRNDIIIEGGQYASIKGPARVTAEAGSLVAAASGCIVAAKPSSNVTAYSGSTVIAQPGSSIIAHNGSTVLAQKGSMIVAHAGARVLPLRSPQQIKRPDKEDS